MDSVTRFDHKYIEVLVGLSDDQLILQRAYAMILKFVPRHRLDYAPELVALYIDSVSEEQLKQDVIRMYENLEILTRPQKRLRDTLDRVISRYTDKSVFQVLSEIAQTDHLHDSQLSDRLCDFRKLTIILIHRRNVTEWARSTLASNLFEKNTNDPQIAMLAAKYAPDALVQASDEILANRAIMFIACCKTLHLMSYLAPSLANDRRFVKAVIQRNPYAIQENVYRNDAEIKTIAIREIIENLKYDQALTLEDTPTYILQDEFFLNQLATLSDSAGIHAKIEEVILERQNSDEELEE